MASSQSRGLRNQPGWGLYNLQLAEQLLSYIFYGASTKSVINTERFVTNRKERKHIQLCMGFTAGDRFRILLEL